MEQYNHNKEQWERLLPELGFKPEYFDMLNKYIATHTQYELINIIQSGQGFPESTLPYALRVFWHLQNDNCLGKINIVDRSSGEGIVPIITTVTKYNFDQQTLLMIQDKEAYMASQFTIDTAENLIKLMKSKEIYVYILFSDMKTIDNVLHIFHRFGTKDKTTE